MERLTSEDIDMIAHHLPSASRTSETINQVFNELYRYKKIEEEIGCPLEVLFRALQQEEIYTAFSKEPKHLMIENRFGKYLIYDKEWLIELKDYKKLWWLKPDRSE